MGEGGGRLRSYLNVGDYPIFNKNLRHFASRFLYKYTQRWWQNKMMNPDTENFSDCISVQYICDKTKSSDRIFEKNLQLNFKFYNVCDFRYFFIFVAIWGSVMTDLYFIIQNIPKHFRPSAAPVIHPPSVRFPAKTLHDANLRKLFVGGIANIHRPWIRHFNIYKYVIIEAISIIYQGLLGKLAAGSYLLRGSLDCEVARVHSTFGFAFWPRLIFPILSISVWHRWAPWSLDWCDCELLRKQLLL